MLDEKGKLTFESFINVMRDKISNTNTELAIKQAFDFFDKDGSRTIDAEEFKKVITFLGQHLEDEAAMDLFNDTTTMVGAVTPGWDLCCNSTTGSQNQLFPSLSSGRCGGAALTKLF
ncbi:hypothetical protein Pelo_4671 [Pelomyxa schiedti]|nr:hypothetical protein Pelo_4671 [Pelomyxa schiedti]